MPECLPNFWKTRSRRSRSARGLRFREWCAAEFWQPKSMYKHPRHDAVHGRGLTEIRRIIERAAISGAAKATAIRIFEALGEAEAEIHNTSIERVHFHEVGAVDAMVAIVSAAVGAESL